MEVLIFAGRYEPHRVVVAWLIQLYQYSVAGAVRDVENVDKLRPDEAAVVCNNSHLVVVNAEVYGMFESNVENIEHNPRSPVGFDHL